MPLTNVVFSDGNRGILNRGDGGSSWSYQDCIRIIIELIHNGQHIEAIKAYRWFTGFGLKESKDACDAIRDVLGVPNDYGSLTYRNTILQDDVRKLKAQVATLEEDKRRLVTENWQTKLRAESSSRRPASIPVTSGTETVEGVRAKFSDHYKRFSAAAYTIASSLGIALERMDALLVDDTNNPYTPQQWRDNISAQVGMMASALQAFDSLSVITRDMRHAVTGQTQEMDTQNLLPVLLQLLGKGGSKSFLDDLTHPLDRPTGRVIDKATGLTLDPRLAPPGGFPGSAPVFPFDKTRGALRGGRAASYAGR